MAVSTQSTPYTQSLSELEKGELSHEKEGVDQESVGQQRGAITQTESAIAESHMKTTTGEVSTTEWDGEDDPDNPYNCTKLF